MDKKDKIEIEKINQTSKNFWNTEDNCKDLRSKAIHLVAAFFSSSNVRWTIQFYFVAMILSFCAMIVVKTMFSWVIL